MEIDLILTSHNSFIPNIQINENETIQATSQRMRKGQEITYHKQSLGWKHWEANHAEQLSNNIQHH